MGHFGRLGMTAALPRQPLDPNSAGGGALHADLPLATCCKPSVIDKMTTRLAEPDNAALYIWRSATVEPVNGHIKDGRGLRQILPTRHGAVGSELSIAGWVTNLSRLYQYPHPAPAT